VFVIDKAVTILVAAAVALGIPAAIKYRAKRNNNGHVSSVASQQLQQEELRWRQDVDEELERFQRALFEPAGAVREGDHNVRKDVTAVISQMAMAMAEQHKELRSDVKSLSAEVSALGRAVAARGNCCEHCER